MSGEEKSLFNIPVPLIGQQTDFPKAFADAVSKMGLTSCKFRCGKDMIGGQLCSKVELAVFWAHVMTMKQEVEMTPEALQQAGRAAALDFRAELLRVLGFHDQASLVLLRENWKGIINVQYDEDSVKFLKQQIEHFFDQLLYGGLKNEIPSEAKGS